MKLHLIFKITLRFRLFYATSTTTTTTTPKPTTTTATAAPLIDPHPHHHHHHDHDHHHGDHQLPWRVDFTDMMGDDLKSKGEDNKKVNPKRSASVEGRSAAPQGDVVFRDPEDFSGDGTFKFPSDANRGRPQRNIPSNIPRVQINVGSDKRRKLSTTTEAPQAPNYQVGAFKRSLWLVGCRCRIVVSSIVTMVAMLCKGGGWFELPG